MPAPSAQPRRTPVQRLADLDARRARLAATIHSDARRADARVKILLGGAATAAAPEIQPDELAGILLTWLASADAAKREAMRAKGAAFFANRAAARKPCA